MTSLRLLGAVGISAILVLSVIAGFELWGQGPVERPLVGAVLYLWYGYNFTSHEWTGALGTSHWNDSAAGLVSDRPSIGYYPSLDNGTLEFQLSGMKEAGISVIVVSWWGTGNATQSGASAKIDDAVNNASLNLFRYLEATKDRWQFKVAMMVEPFNSSYDMTPLDYAELYGYLRAHYYGPYDNLVLRWQGKPLLMSFNARWPGYGGGFQAGRLPANSTFTYRLVGGTPNHVDWTFWAGMNFLDMSGGNAEPQNYQQSPVVSTDGEVGIAPRYDDYRLWLAGERSSYMRFDYEMTQGMYSSEWGYVLGHAEDIGLILINSWNEYHERTAIEPHFDSTSSVIPTYLVNQTAGYVRALG